jgi:hypothetical protein
MYETRAPFVGERIRAAAVHCSDGRYGAHMDEFVQEHLGLPRYDRLAIPGGAGCFAGHLTTWKEEAALEHQLDLLVEVHGLKRVILIAHQDCAFYTVRLKIAGAELERIQREDLVVAAQRVRRLHAEIEVENWFARRDGERVRFEAWSAA